MPKRMDNPNDNYQRKTATKLGKQTMWYIKKEDFEKMQRACLVHMQKAEQGSALEYHWHRNYVLLMAGVNLGCRTNTMLELTPRNFAGGHFYVKEHKTGKVEEFELRPEMYKLLEEFTEKWGFTKDECIFRKTYTAANVPLTRQAAWAFVKKLADEVGIKYNVGAYSLRKSFARWLYDDCHDIYKVMRVMQHTDPQVTARYICLEQEDVLKTREGIQHGFGWYRP